MNEFAKRIFVIQHKQTDGRWVESNWDNIAHPASNVDSNESHSVWCLTGHQGFFTKDKALAALTLVREKSPSEKFRISEYYIEQKLISSIYENPELLEE